jgi:hypothetical protein
VGQIPGVSPAPSFAHAAETFLVAHTLPGAWSTNTAIKYRQTLAALAGRLADTPVGADLAVLDGEAGAAQLAEAFTAALPSVVVALVGVACQPGAGRVVVAVAVDRVARCCRHVSA